MVQVVRFRYPSWLGRWVSRSTRENNLTVDPLPETNSKRPRKWMSGRQIFLLKKMGDVFRLETPFVKTGVYKKLRLTPKRICSFWVRGRKLSPPATNHEVLHCFQKISTNCDDRTDGPVKSFTTLKVGHTTIVASR